MLEANVSILTKEEVITMAKNIYQKEIDALNRVYSQIDESIFEAATMVLECKGKIIICGVGKSGLVGKKIAATLCSMGSPALFLHPTEAQHGDLGVITKEDVIICISYSGESSELTNLLPILKKKNVNIIAITGNKNSLLAKYSNCILSLNVDIEACPFNLAPTSSTTATMVLGDCLAIIVSQMRGFSSKDFANNHPSGILGRKLLLKVNDLMEGNLKSINIEKNATVRDAIFKITESRMGAANVVDSKGQLIGLITDGDIRRYLGKENKDLASSIDEVMNFNCIKVLSDTLVSNALKILMNNNISVLPIVDIKGRSIGMINIKDIIRAGLL